MWITIIFLHYFLLLLRIVSPDGEESQTTSPHIYSYLPISDPPAFIPAGEIQKTMQQPRLPEVQFHTIEELGSPPDLIYGRFHGFFRMFDKLWEEPINRTRIYMVRKALANVIHYIESGTFIRIKDRFQSEPKFPFEEVLNMWQAFYYCITTYNFRNHSGPCTYQFVYTVNASHGYHSIMDWDPARDLDLLPNRDQMLLVLFNLGLCQNYQHYLPFLCPSLCLGRLSPGSDLSTLPVLPGNPCETVHNTRSPACFTRRIWSIFVYNLFKELVNPATWTLIPGENTFLDWAKKESGYACDCAAQYRWVDTSLQCERTAEWVDQCKSSPSGSPHNLGPCNRNGTYQCTTDQNTGDAYCDCLPGFIGARCEKLLDACIMSLVTYVYKDPKTGKKERKVASGMEMCNVNMSGMQTPTETVMLPDDSEYIDGQLKAKVIFLHSKCIPSLGTTGYRCQCQPPFTEDTTHPMPNCLKRTGPCDDRLCLHGTCVASSEQNSTSICVCNPGYDGPQCERRADHWSVWSECLPICGTNRTRTRRRSTTIRDPSAWEPHFDDLAGVPNTMSDLELFSYPGELIQAEVCPPRTGTQCPFSPNSPNYQSLASTDPGLLELQAFLSLAISTFLLLIGISACITRVVRGLIH